MSSSTPIASSPEQATVQLETPLQRGEHCIDTLTLRKPKAGELRGLNLADITRCDVNAIHALLPRISSPTLTTAEIAELDIVDLSEIAFKIMEFFLSKTARTAVSQLISKT